MFPYPLDEVIYGSEKGNVLHFHFASLGKSAEIKVLGLVEGGHGHLFILVDDWSWYVWLEPAVSCSGEVALRTIMKWCGLSGVVKNFVNDGASHSRNKVLETVAETIGVAHFFTVAHSSVERMNREVVRTFGLCLNKQRSPVSE